MCWFMVIAVPGKQKRTKGTQVPAIGEILGRYLNVHEAHESPSGKTVIGSLTDGQAYWVDDGHCSCDIVKSGKHRFHFLDAIPKILDAYGELAVFIHCYRGYISNERVTKKETVIVNPLAFKNLYANLKEDVRYLVKDGIYCGSLESHEGTGIELKIELRGAAYQEALAFCFQYCSHAQLVVRDYARLDATAWESIAALAPFQIWVKDEEPLPDSDAIGQTTKVYHYRYTLQSLKVFTERVTGLYDWKHPDQPEDLTLIRGNGSIMLMSNAQAGRASLFLSSSEEEALRSHGVLKNHIRSH